ncbi:MAG TPA: DUF4190 domain-containing protein [Xanthomonadaceae bacterium]|nr:DUF4190 domain-containing protein [Xanthomonadaceae bacterium]
MNAPAPANSNAAIVSLVFGILSWVLLPVIGAIVAIIAGHMARGEIRRTPGLGGDTMALIGLLLGYAHLAVIFIGIALLVLFFGGLAALAVLGGG